MILNINQQSFHIYQVRKLKSKAVLLFFQVYRSALRQTGMNTIKMEIFKINTNAVVLIDRDRDNGDDPINDTKQRIADEALTPNREAV